MTPARAAIFVGALVWFVAAVDLTRAIRISLLLDVEPAWAAPRLLLSVFVAAGAAGAGALAAGVFLLASRSFARLAPVSLPWPRRAVALLAVGAIAAGALIRFAMLDRLPPWLWVDDLSLIAPALDLQGNWSDFSDSIRPAPFGVAEPYGSVGVLYLELYRWALLLFGTEVFGVRFLSAAAGTLSLVTAYLLGRALLPRGGGALAALVLAGLRWNLILSRWGWNAIVLAPILDIAFLLLLRARRRGSLGWAAGAGIVAGLATHVYLAAWVGAAAMLAASAWPGERSLSVRTRGLLAAVFALACAAGAAPIFLLREGRTFPYFARASSHNVVREIERQGSVMPLLAAGADTVVGPWFLGDPTARNDLSGRSRLSWILGVAVAVSLARSLLRPAEDFSLFLLAHSGAAFAASVAGGQAGVPNGYRFAYISDVAAVAAAGGLLSLLALAPEHARRAAALVVVGLVSVSAALGARDALRDWPERKKTFDGFFGEDTMLARAMLRWEAFGSVELAPGVAHSEIAVEAVRRYRLDPENRVLGRFHANGNASPGERHFRVVPPGTPVGPGERAVERVRDLWGREWGIVLGRKSPPRGAGAAFLRHLPA